MRMPPAVRSNEVGVERDEGIVLFQSALHEERYCALRGAKVPVEIDPASLGQVIHNERTICNAHAGILDEWQLALGRLAWIGRVDGLVGNLGNAQPGLELAAERAQVRDREHARKLEELEGWMRSARHELGAAEAAACANASRRRPQSPVVSKMVRISSRRAP